MAAISLDVVTWAFIRVVARQTKREQTFVREPLVGVMKGSGTPKRPTSPYVRERAHYERHHSKLPQTILQPTPGLAANPPLFQLRVPYLGEHPTVYCLAIVMHDACLEPVNRPIHGKFLSVPRGDCRK